MIAQYIIFNVLNVIIQTIKSIVTIKCNKYAAAAVNALAYGLYTYIIVLTNADLNLWFKILVVSFANLVGVFLVKLFEEKSEKEKLWKIEVTIPTDNALKVDDLLENIPHSYLTISGKHTIFNIYCSTKEQSKRVSEIIKFYNAKFFVTEEKTSLL